MPFEVVDGQSPPSLVPYLPATARVAAVDHQLRDHDKFLLDIHDCLVLAQDTMREIHDKKCRFMEFSVGD